MLSLSVEISKNTFYEPLVCRVCGDLARGNNFQVVTCMSCKSFFRRNAFQPWGILQCHNRSDCIITKTTRIKCPACRLNKCFAVGMNPKLIRSAHQHQLLLKNREESLSGNQKQSSFLTFRSLNALKNDNSILSCDHWSLFPSTDHQYHYKTCNLNNKSRMNKQSSLPPKLRFKSKNKLNSVSSFVQNNSMMNEYLFKTYKSPKAIHQTEVSHSFSSINNIHGFFITDGSNPYHNSIHLTASNELHGSTYVREIISICKQLEPNLSFAALMIFVLNYSNNFTIVTFNKKDDIKMTPHSSDLIQSQHIHVTILWKYFINQYGFIEAVRRFDFLIKNILIIFHTNEKLCRSEIKI